jgi:hypothetical protein
LRHCRGRKGWRRCHPQWQLTASQSVSFLVLHSRCGTSPCTLLSARVISAYVEVINHYWFIHPFIKHLFSHTHC